jgi:hypothetical protein
MKKSLTLALCLTYASAAPLKFLSELPGGAPAPSKVDSTSVGDALAALAQLGALSPALAPVPAPAPAPLLVSDTSNGGFLIKSTDGLPIAELEERIVIGDVLSRQVEGQTLEVVFEAATNDNSDVFTVHVIHD